MMPPAEEKPVRVLITIPIAEELLIGLRQVSPRVEITSINTHRADGIPPEAWLEAEVLYTDRVLPAPEQAPNLRWVQFHFTGIEYAIEAPVSRRPGMLLTHQSGATSPQVAEYILMMFMALSHHLPLAFANQQKIDWPHDRWERFSARELRGSTVGIVGYGSVGRELARLLQPFGVKVLAVKRDLMNMDDTGYAIEGLGDPHGDLFTRLYPMEALASVLKECDFVSVNLPLTPATTAVVGLQQLQAMKPGAYLVVVGRGAVVDQKALIDLLEDHKIAGAALDAFPEEPLPVSSPFWKLPNVLITPHISAITPQYDARCMALFSENMRRYLAGQNLANRFDFERGY
jgi:phosphoglycerate dehydrogenase-like enzyme